MTDPKPPTPQGISVLLRKAGFERAEKIRGGRHHGENTAGYRVHSRVGEIRVHHWSATVPSTARTTEFVTEERKQTLEMLDRYAEVIRAAGWTVSKVRAFTVLTVTAPEAVLVEPKTGPVPAAAAAQLAAYRNAGQG